jgi:hypothetical protein
MHRGRQLIALASLVLAVGEGASAQTLLDPTEAQKAMEVIHFGMPSDAKYVFCSGGDCPERSTKTVPAPRMAAPAPVITRALAPVVPPQATLPAPELSRATVEPPARARAEAPKKTSVRTKRATPAKCGPDAK